jgi:hypothetical protein
MVKVSGSLLGHADQRRRSWRMEDVFGLQEVQYICEEDMSI